MKWLNGSKMRLMLVGIVAAVVLSGGNAKADFTFGEATNMGPLINSAARDASAFITPDGLQMYFGSDREGGLGNYDLWTSSRPTTEDEWGEPVNLGEPFNSPAGDLGPCLSADGLEFYFARVTEVTYELWVAKRASINDPWGEPEILGPTVDSTFDGCGPSISPDGLTLYFYDGDIWMTTRPTISDTWGPSIKLESPISTEADEGWPHITADGLALLFGSDREGGYGGNDVLMVRRSNVSDTWGSPINLGPPANMTAFESCSYVSSDGLTYYFTSNRDGGQGSYDLWQAKIIPIVDFDRDRTVGFSDLMLMVESWGTDDPQCDIGPMPWGDGIVDGADLEVLMSYWGQEVSYLNDPKQASRPTPLDNAISDVEKAGSIRWVPGRHAVGHDVYVGTDAVAVEDADTSDTTGIYRGQQEGNEYILPEAILPNQTFYWRIDEFNTDSTLTKGPVWSFSMADYLIVDDFESSEAAWARWWDGWGDPNNGSEVATEIMTVHSGNQAMWLTYDNSTAPISQVLRLWETPQDWTRKGVETLIVWVHGGPDNTAEPLQIILGDSADNVATVVHPDPMVLLMDNWEQWSIPLADVTGINPAEITSMTLVIGDETTQESGTGKIYIDDICLHPVSVQDTPGQAGGNIIWVSNQADDNQDGVPDDQEWVEILEAEGYSVHNEKGYWKTLDDDKIAALNAADLIIISRNTGYGGGWAYANDDMELTQWDSVTTPIINTSAILAEDNRWKWLNVPWFSVGNSLNSKLDILAPDHPIFDGMTSPVQITRGEGITHFANVTGVGVGNGSMLAQLATPTEAEYAAIVEWEPGVEYYEGAGRIPAGLRMLFCAGTVQRNDDDPAGMGAMNLTPDGLKIFLNAVKMYVEK